MSYIGRYCSSGLNFFEPAILVSSTLTDHVIGKITKDVLLQHHDYLVTYLRSKINLFTGPVLSLSPSKDICLISTVLVPWVRICIIGFTSEYHQEDVGSTAGVVRKGGVLWG